MLEQGKQSEDGLLVGQLACRVENLMLRCILPDGPNRYDELNIYQYQLNDEDPEDKVEVDKLRQVMAQLGWKEIDFTTLKSLKKNRIPDAQIPFERVAEIEERLLTYARDYPRFLPRIRAMINKAKALEELSDRILKERN